ncbi:MAG: ATP-binding protein, partial [Thermomicrobiales bacterium]
MRQIPRSAYIEPLVLSRTSFVGRTAHLAAVGRYLRSQQARLITLIGPGGVGKTRLALRAASLHADDFADGCHIVVLAEARTPETVLPAIARQLGLREEPHRSSADHLAHALRDQHLLLLLDNLEHVTAAAPSIAALLERCPRLTILATSRSPLRIQGEREYPVPPLLLPGLERLPPLDELRRCEAIALFIQRAQAVRPDFALTTANGPDIAEICTRLDGLPLAIELAAARLKVLSPQALLARLSGRLQLLTGGARDQPPRLQSLREAIAWSYDLLDPNEQSLFRRLAVFAGDFTLPAADAVASVQEPVPSAQPGDASDGPQRDPAVGPPLSVTDWALGPGHSALDLLTALVDHSLVQRSDRDEDEPRYRFLETIRMFALEQLAAAGEEAETRARHAAWCLELAETAAPALHEPPPARWLDQLATAEANLHAAQDWMLANRQWALGLRLAVALYDFWLTRGAGRDEAGWIERILAITPDALAGDRGLDHARVLNLLGVLRYYAGDHEAARTWYEASLARRRTLGD